MRSLFFGGSIILAVLFAANLAQGRPLGRGRYEAITWSPDGSYLAFTFEGASYPELWLFEVSTGTYRQIDMELNGRIVPSRGLAWQNNNTLWFLEHFSGESFLANTSALSRVEIESDAAETVLEIVPWGWHSFAIHPTRTNEVLFSQTPQRSTVSQPHNHDLYLLDLNDESITHLTDSPDIDETDVSWLPDGSYRASSWDGITLVDPLTGEARILDVGVYYGGNKYTWSPDGQWILYIGDHIGGRGLYLASTTEGIRSRSILTAPFLEVAWSPTGDYVAYTTVSSPGSGNELYILPANDLGLDAAIDEMK